MPLARDLANSRYQQGKAEQALYDTYSASPSEVSEKTPQTVDKTRVSKCTEETVDRHFFIGAELQNTLVRLGIMDPITKKSKRCVLNRDEMPQYFDHKVAKGGKKVECGKGTPALSY